MERKNLEITYQKISDYLIPNIVLPKEATHYNIGKYGYLRLEYLKEHKRGLYTKLLMQCNLNKYLFEINNEAHKQVDTLIKQLTEKENVSQYNIQSDSLNWVQKMNNIKNRAEEIVLKELIYC